MKNESKKIGLILLAVAVVILIVVVFFVRRNSDVPNNTSTDTGNTNTNNQDEQYVQVLEDNTKVNISDKLKETKNVNGLQFSNIQLTSKSNQTELLADVVNNTGKDIEDLTFVTVQFVDENGQQITTADGMIEPLKVGQTVQFIVSTTLDYANVYDINITMK